MKETVSQKLAKRKPRQHRAQHKVELILEAAVRLLAKGGLAALTTNAVAETAGVSIGTLYQYFANKEAILDALADRELAEQSERVLIAMQEPGAISEEDRVTRIVHAVMSSYGGRRQVHRLVAEHSLHLGAIRLAPLIEQLIGLMTAASRPWDSGDAAPTSHADAFVLTNAFAGVLRAMILWDDSSTPPQEEVEEALVRLVLNFADSQATRAISAIV